MISVSGSVFHSWICSGHIIIVSGSKFSQSSILFISILLPSPEYNLLILEQNRNTWNQILQLCSHHQNQSYRNNLTDMTSKNHLRVYTFSFTPIRLQSLIPT